MEMVGSLGKIEEKRTYILFKDHKRNILDKKKTKKTR